MDKAEILKAAINAAAENGFDFMAWYKVQFNFTHIWRMPQEARIELICNMGIENVLIFNHDFVQSLIKKDNWKEIIQTWVLSKYPVFSLYRYLVRRGILDE